jgi:hypothetical protein
MAREDCGDQTLDCVLRVIVVGGERLVAKSFGLLRHTSAPQRGGLGGATLEPSFDLEQNQFFGQG